MFLTGAFPAISVATYCLLGVALTLCFIFYFRRPGKLPPGPWRLPLLGNAHQLPSKTPWTVFGQWAKTYGNIIHVDLFGQSIILVNSQKIAFDLMDKRSTNYSDRPIIPIAAMSQVGDTFALQSYNDSWRRQRKMIAQEFTAAGVSRFQSLQEREWRLQVKRILHNPDTIFSEIKLRAGVIAIRALYGYYVRTPNDPMLSNPIEVIREFSRLSTPQTGLAFRFLPRWTPGVTFFKEALDYERLHVAATVAPYEWCKTNLETPKVLVPNVCCDIWEKNSVLDQDGHKQVYNALSSALGGGLDSNASSALTFFMTMILHPEVQQKAQMELDTIIGFDRLPDINDQSRLPYVRAVLAETLRFMPPIPLCIPHALKEDDIYEGYFLPKGAWVIPNIWNMLRDPIVYSDPMTFNPDRYKGDDKAMEQVKNLVFGFGRRGCPGRLFAENSLFVLIATTLATCNISPGLDENGKQVLPNGNYTSGTISFPEPFKITINPRSTNTDALLAEVHELYE
ncbi:putative monooxygenase [Crepidotus variabilis]|uniref:Monooxygenase n=1 Tax=Crepidotus variabilis TaxID=179855 RepID=A0A9P6E7J4_9AGAR|nr:putative monooxygenase [Crepidotus variabilis]